MSDSTKVNVEINTKADLKGVQGANTQLKSLATNTDAAKVSAGKLKSEQDPLQEQMNATKAALDKLKTSVGDLATAQDTASTSAGKLTPELQKLGDKQDAVSGKSGGLGKALLGVGTDAAKSQSGVGELATQVEGLVLALGAGTGLAGVLTLAATGAALLATNWEKLFEAAQNKPDWTQLTPEEEHLERLEKFNDKLKTQAELLERIGTARSAAIQIQKEQIEQEEKNKAIWQDLLPSTKDDLPPLPGTEGPSVEAKKKALDLADARENTAQAVAAKIRADAAFEAQKKIVDDQSKRTDLTRSFEFYQGEDQSRLNDLTRSFGESGERGGTPEIQQEIQNLRDAIATRAKEFQQQTAGLERVPLTKKLTGDNAKDEAILKESLQVEQEKLKTLDENRKQAAQRVQGTMEPLNEAFRAANYVAVNDASEKAAEGFKGLGLPPPPGVIPRMDAAAGFDLSKPLQDAESIKATQAQISSRVGEVTGMNAQIASSFERAFSAFFETLQNIKRTADSAAAVAQQTRDMVRP